MPDHNVLFGASLGQWNGADAADAAGRIRLATQADRDGRLLLAAGATLADPDRHGTPAADRIQSPALRTALAAGQL